MEGMILSKDASITQQELQALNRKREESLVYMKNAVAHIKQRYRRGEMNGTEYQIELKELPHRLLRLFPEAAEYETKKKIKEDAEKIRFFRRNFSVEEADKKIEDLCVDILHNAFGEGV